MDDEELGLNTFMELDEISRFIIISKDTMEIENRI